MATPTMETADEVLEVLVKVKKREMEGFGVREALHLLLAGIYREGVFEGGGQDAVDRLDRRHHATEFGDVDDGGDNGRERDRGRDRALVGSDGAVVERRVD